MAFSSSPSPSSSSSYLLSSLFFYPTLLFFAVTQIRGRAAGSPPPYGSCLHLYREKTSAISTLVASRLNNLRFTSKRMAKTKDCLIMDSPSVEKLHQSGIFALQQLARQTFSLSRPKRITGTPLSHLLVACVVFYSRVYWSLSRDRGLHETQRGKCIVFVFPEMH